MCVLWRSVDSVTNALDVPASIARQPSDASSASTSGLPSKKKQRGSNELYRKAYTGPGKVLLDEWIKAKTVVWPSSSVWTTLDLCHESYMARVRDVHACVPLSRPVFTYALRQALAAEEASGRVKYTYVRLGKVIQCCIRGLHVDGATVEPEALLEEWFHARVAFDPASDWVPLASFFESFRSYLLPVKGVDRERWAVLEYMGRRRFMNLFRKRLEPLAQTKRVVFKYGNLAVKGLMLV